jgi:amino acid adenylation domain-containing protein
MSGLYKKFLNLINKQPDENEKPDIIKEEQLNQSHNGAIGPVVKYPTDKTLIDLFLEQVEKKPDNTALIYRDEKLSFRQLNEKANQLAHYLRQKGVKEETLVPLCIERSIEMMVAILGIMKAGGVYVPIDPDVPPQRIEFLLEDIGVNTVIAGAGSKTKLLGVKSQLDIITFKDNQRDIDQMPVKNPANHVEPRHLAYIIYTSGSTGLPKGVMVEHKSIHNYLLNSREKFIKEGENGSGTFIHIPYTFDASLKSIFTPLVSGKLAVISSEPSPFVFEDENLHRYAPYDFIQLTPAHLDFFYAEFKDKRNKAITGKVSIGGEALYLNHFDPLIDKKATLEVINEYGPTETVVACTGYYFNFGIDADLPRSLPIGKPINNVQIYLLDEDLSQIQPGEEGEICVGGVQVARGYLNQPELTKMKFIPNPFSDNEDDKIYKTGDIGRLLPDGNIEYVGRKDTQVKIRGYRIELGEIESVLIQSENIKNVVVEAPENKQGDKQLVAYIIPNGTFDKQAILTYLKSKLPSHLIPERLVEMKSLPLTSNGKIDRKSLTSI